MNADKTTLCETLLDEFKTHPVTGGSSAMAVVMQMLLKHTADMLEVVVEAVAEKYGHSVDEMMETVKTHPKFLGLEVDPAIHALAGAAAPAPAKRRGRKKLEEMTPEELATHKARVEAAREKRKTPPASPPAAAAPPAAAQPPLEEIANALAKPVAEDAVPATPAPVKRTFTIKPKKKVEAA